MDTNTGIPKNRSKRRDNASDTMPSFKRDAEANIGEIFYSRETLKLSFKKDVNEFVRYDDESVPGPQGPPGLPGVGGGGLEGSAYVFVAADGTPIENATELKAKYALAKTLTTQTNVYTYAVSNVIEAAGVYTVLFENNSSLSEFSWGSNNVIINNTPYVINVIDISTSFGLQFTGIPSGLAFTAIQKPVVSQVKMTLIVAPGEYNFQQETFVIDHNLVNVVSLTGNADVKLSINQVLITADNILVKGLDVLAGAFKIGGSLNNLVVEKCKGGYESFNLIVVNSYQQLSSTFTDCVGLDSSFGGASPSSYITGTFNNCVGTTGAFSPFQGYLNGTFNNCKGTSNAFSPAQGGAYGTFNNCIGMDYSFAGYNSTIGGTYNNCVSTYSSFAGNYVYGTFTNCKADANSFKVNFGDATYINCNGTDYCFNGQGGNLNGSFINCKAANYSFGGNNSYTSVYGFYKNCIAGMSSFAGEYNNKFEGTAINCNAQPGSFGGHGGSDIPKRISGKIISCQIFGNAFLDSSYFEYNGQLAGCFDSTGFIASRTA